MELFTNKIKGKQQKHGPLVRRGSTIGAKSTVGSQVRGINRLTMNVVRVINIFL